MSLWRSRGLTLWGIEIKVSRSDWRRELKDPAKADSIFRFCDGWLIVAPVGVVPLDEVPPTWGLWELTPGGKWKYTRQPPKLAPDPLDRPFLAALLRRASELATNGDGVQAARAEGFKAGQESAARTGERVQSDLKELRAAVELFEQRSGVRITTWDAANIGEAVLAVRQGAHHNARQRLLRLSREVDALAASLRETVERQEKEALKGERP